MQSICLGVTGAVLADAIANSTELKVHINFALQPTIDKLNEAKTMARRIAPVPDAKVLTERSLYAVATDILLNTHINRKGGQQTLNPALTTFLRSSLSMEK